MQEIIAHTPRWVFGLFIALVYLGLQQSKVRTVTITRLTLLPLAMLGLSFSGVWNTFNGASLGITFWLAAMVATALLAQWIAFDKGVRYLPETRSFILPGSWLPLALMMAIFFTKYAVGIVLSQRAELAAMPAFVIVVSLAYGFFSGAFFGRTLKIMVSHGRQALNGIFA